MVNFDKAVNTLIDLAKKTCTGVFSSNVFFIKCYNPLSPFSITTNRREYEYYSFKNRVFSPASQIKRDIEQLAGKRSAPFISWVELLLYYSSAEETIILVYLHFSDKPSELKYHVGVMSTTKDGQTGVNNYYDYVNHILSKKS